MKSLSSLNYEISGTILMFFYFLFLLQFGCLLLSERRFFQKQSRFRWFVLALTGVPLVFLRVFNERTELGFTPPREPKLPFMEQIPVWILVGYLFILCGITGFMIVQVVQLHQHKLTRSAIKESFDNLPMGLSFSTPEGFVFLANRKIEELCFFLIGRDFQDAAYFWNQLTRHPDSINGVKISYGKHPCFQLDNLEIWTFEQDFVETDGEKVIQITAVNITELYHISKTLKENNEKLSEMNIRLKQYSENMDTYVRSRELLETKVHIHQKMGQALLASRAYLQNNEIDLTAEEILKRWEDVLLLLKKENESTDGESSWKNFVKEAGAAGVQVITTGSIQAKKEQMELIIMAAIEALTNAVRHAQADQLYINFSESSSGEKCICFSNNGRQPEGVLLEGGGLSSLRAKVEQAGGTMELRTQPEFCLLIRFVK